MGLEEEVGGGDGGAVGEEGGVAEVDGDAQEITNSRSCRLLHPLLFVFPLPLPPLTLGTS